MFRALVFACLIMLADMSRAQSFAEPESVSEPMPAPPVPRTHHLYLVLGSTMLLAEDGRTYFGADWAMGCLVSRRLAIGGTLSISGRRAAATAYGFRATAPAVGIYSLEGSSRYALVTIQPSTASSCSTASATVQWVCLTVTGWWPPPLPPKRVPPLATSQCGWR